MCRLHSSIRCSLSRVLTPFAEKRAIGQDHRGPTVGLEQADDEGQEKVGRLAGLEMLGEVALDAVLFPPTKGRIGEHDIHAISLACS